MNLCAPQAEPCCASLPTFRSVRLEEPAWKLGLADDRQESPSPQLIMIWNGDRPGRALGSKLHRDVAPATQNLNESVFCKDAADLPPGKRAKPTQP